MLSVSASKARARLKRPWGNCISPRFQKHRQMEKGRVLSPLPFFCFEVSLVVQSACASTVGLILHSSHIDSGITPQSISRLKT